MKKLICGLAAFIILSAIPCTAAAAPPSWTLVPIPASQSAAPPVYADISGFVSDITVDVNNNFYVMCDSIITRFNSAGQIDETWGNNGSIYDGELEAQNSEMLDIAADSRGYVYAHCRILVDGSPTFIKRYTPDGEADKAWYGDGVMGGKFSGGNFVSDETEPKGGIRNEDEIALDSKDNLYVLCDRQVYKFLRNGAPDKKWRSVKMKQPKTVYAEDGGVSYSNAMRVDRSGNVYLFNGYDRILSKFSRTGILLKRYKCPLYYRYVDDFGDTSYLISQVAFDSKGNIYTINQYGNILKYSAKMKRYKTWCGGAFTIGKDSESVRTITDFAMDAAGGIYILDKEAGIVSKYTNGGEKDLAWGSGGSIGNVNGSGKAMLGITDIVPDTDGSMYAITDYLSDGGAIITKVNSDFTLDSTWGADVYGSFTGYKTDAFSSMAARNGSLYVGRNVNGTAGGLIKLKDGKEDSEWNIKSSGPVWDIMVDSNGGIYAAGERITRYLPNGKADESWGVKGSVDGVEFLGEIATDSKGRLYISDRGGNYVIRYTAKGQMDRSWGEGGKAYIPGAAGGSEAYYTYCIAIDSADSMYLSDYINKRLLKFNSEGRLDTSWCDGGVWEYASGELLPMGSPTHIMICGGRLYAIWNGKLFVMNDSLAKVGVKAPKAPPSEPVIEAVITAQPPAVWRWAVSIGGLLFCAGAIYAMIRLLPKKNRKRRLAKVKSIKIAKK